MWVMPCKPHAALQVNLFISAQTLSRKHFLLDRKHQVDESGANLVAQPPSVAGRGRTGHLDHGERLTLELARKLAGSLPVTQINGG